MFWVRQPVVAVVSRRGSVVQRDHSDFLDFTCRRLTFPHIVVTASMRARAARSALNGTPDGSESPISKL